MIGVNIEKQWYQKRRFNLKKILFLLISILVMIPSIASAHTELTSSTPAAGQVVTEDIKEIVLTYQGKIESLSTMEVVKDEQEVAIVSVTPKEKQMVGTLSVPLENGSYTIKWTIAGEDGHPITGEIPFMVQKEEEVEQKMEAKEPLTTTNEHSKTENNSVIENTTKQNNDSSSNMITIITVAVILILGLGLILLFRRKR
jgi:copper resistance protein C